VINARNDFCGRNCCDGSNGLLLNAIAISISKQNSLKISEKLINITFDVVKNHTVFNID
jgi:hypothetical protein